MYIFRIYFQFKLSLSLGSFTLIKTCEIHSFEGNVVSRIEYILLEGKDRISGSVFGIRRNPAIFQLFGIRPDTGY